ncbi:hypothetical protein MmiEs2_06210 [Methanimicrococcus stummii]|uniref:Uncharacterized protein n=1 Tax=Methanimicrococcus stummii TaxID=3028294 RepID=A0AA96V9M5_9EURY|nr:hypothetical protein MmiEs2_06210 [Methanimicrococcus sp. Es2]
MQLLQMLNKSQSKESDERHKYLYPFFSVRLDFTTIFDLKMNYYSKPVYSRFCCLNLRIESIHKYHNYPFHSNLKN